MTREELNNNYEFKVVQRALKQDFPFIKEIKVSDEALTKYTKDLYIDLVIDPYMIGHMYGLTVWTPVTRDLKEGRNYWAPYLSTFFSLDDNRHSKVEDTKEIMSTTRPISKAIEKMMDGIHVSKALPSEYKLPKQLSVGSFIATPESLPPDILTIPN